MSQSENIYVIPNFQPSEIISYFAEQNITIHNSEIVKPTSQTSLKIFNTLLNYVYQKNTSEMVDESKLLFVVFKRTDKLLRRLGIDFFELKDLQFPSYQRNLNFISTIYNFCIYKDSKKEFLQSIVDERADQERNIVEIEEEISKLKNMLKKQKEDEKKKEEENKELLKQVSVLEEEVKGIFKAQREKVSRVDALKKERDDHNDRLNSLKLEQMNIQQDIKEIKAQIVDDPSQMVNLIQEMEHLVKSEREGLEDLNQKLKQKKEQIRMSEEKKIRLQNKIKIAITSQKKNKEIRDLSIVLREYQENNQNLNSEIDLERKRSGNLSKQIAQIEFKINDIKQKEQENTALVSERLTKLREEYETVRLERKRSFEKIEENQKEIKNLEFEIAQITNKHQKNIHILITKMNELKNEVKKHLQGFEDFIREN